MLGSVAQPVEGGPKATGVDRGIAEQLGLEPGPVYDRAHESALS